MNEQLCWISVRIFVRFFFCSCLFFGKNNNKRNSFIFDKFEKNNFCEIHKNKMQSDLK
jgi:hypothetical protein